MDMNIFYKEIDIDVEKLAKNLLNKMYQENLTIGEVKGQLEKFKKIAYKDDKLKHKIITVALSLHERETNNLNCSSLKSEVN